MPTPVVQLGSRDGTRKRRLERISISPEPVAIEDILLAGSSDDDSEPTRLRKRAKRQGYAEYYLKHGWVPIMTASLRGPFDKGWKNPWAKTKSNSNLINHPSRTSDKGLIHQREETPSPAPRQDRVMIKSGVLEATSRHFPPREFSSAIPSRTKRKPNAPHELDQASESRLLDFRQHDRFPVTSKSTNLSKDTAPEYLSTKARDRKQSGSHKSSRSSNSIAHILDHTSHDSAISTKHTPKINLDLEDDLNVIWSRGSLHGNDRILQTMKWQRRKSRSSLVQGQSPSKRVLLYGDMPVLLPNGQVNRFSIHHLKDIRAKLSQGITRVRQRFDTFSATQNTSDTIACCNMLSQLAQILQQIDHARRLHDDTEDLSSGSSTWLGLRTSPGRFQQHSISGFLNRNSNDGSSSSEHNPTIEQGPGPRMHHLRKTGETQTFEEGNNDNQNESVISEDNENDGDADMTDPGVFEPMDVSFGSQAAVGSMARNSDQNQPATPNDMSLLTSSRDTLLPSAFSSKSENISPLPLGFVDDNLYDGDPNELLMGGTVFVGGSSNPFTGVNGALIDSNKTNNSQGMSADKQLENQSRETIQGTTISVEPAGNLLNKSLQTTSTSARRPLSSHKKSDRVHTQSDQQSRISRTRRMRASGQSPQQSQRQVSEPDSGSATKTSTTPYQPIESASLSRTPLQLRTAEEKNAVESPSVIVLARPHVRNDDGPNRPAQIVITSTNETIHDGPTATIVVNPKIATQEVEVVQLDSDSELSSLGSSEDANDEQQNGSSTPKVRREVREIASPGKESATTSTSITNTSTTRDSLSAQPDHQVAESESQTRLGSFLNVLKQVQTSVQQKVAQIGHSQPEKPPERKEDNQELEAVDLAVSLDNSKETNENGVREAQEPIRIVRTETSIDQLATEVPPLRWADTVEKDHLSLLDASITKVSSTPRQSPTKRAYSPSPSAVSTAAIMQQLATEAKFRPILSASQPAARSTAFSMVQPRRIRSNSAAIGDEESVTVRNSIEADNKAHVAPDTMAESYLEDAQRQRPYITDSEEREALDAASSLLDIWDLEKEAFASR